MRPTFVESHLSRTAYTGGSNVTHHLLRSYRASLIAICRAQLDARKRMVGGMHGASPRRQRGACPPRPLGGQACF